MIQQPRKQKKNENPSLYFTKSEVDKYFKNVQVKAEIDIDDIKIQRPKAVKRQKVDEAGNVIEVAEEEKKAPVNKRQKKAAAKKAEKEVILPREDI